MLNSSSKWFRKALQGWTVVSRVDLPSNHLLSVGYVVCVVAFKCLFIISESWVQHHKCFLFFFLVPVANKRIVP
jgi:hypothetical protein